MRTECISAILVVLISVACPLLLRAEGKDWADGYDWENQDYSWKMAYLTGYLRGLIHTARHYSDVLRESLHLSEENIGEMERAAFDELFFPISDPQRLLKGLDELYRDDANKPIAVSKLAVLLKKRDDGSLSAGDMDKELQKLRKLYSSIR